MPKDVAVTEDDVVVLDYADLSGHADLGASIAKAFGPDGIGLLVVRGVPQLEELREGLLPLGFEFAALPDEVKARYVHPDSNYSFGWSHGKEVLKPGVFDEFKGSYYANPQYDVPCDDPAKIAAAPEVCHPNVWPSEADFPKLRGAFMALGQRMVDVGLLVAEQCDRYVATALGAPLDPAMRLAKVIEESRACKARLLYYFAINEDATPRTRDSWCGWHSDHGSLTALCPAMYFEAPPDAALPTKSDIRITDKEAGLYIRARNGVERKVTIPKDCLAFQIGESSQVMTGGLLRATPHAVQALAHPASRHVSRANFAVFMQPDNEVAMSVPAGAKLEDVSIGKYRPGMTFGDFSKATFAGYYATYT